MRSQMNIFRNAASSRSMFGAASAVVLAGALAFAATFTNSGNATSYSGDAGATAIASGKADNLCANETWPPVSKGCLSRIMGNASEATVRVVGAGTIEATRAVNPEIEAATQGAMDGGFTSVAKDSQS